MIVFTIGFLENPSDFILFLGRLHPLVVHLPIGFIFMAVIAQFASQKPKFKPLEPFVSYIWLLGIASTFFAVLFGYFLSLSGDYDPDTLFWHKWMGVGVLLFIIGCYYSTKQGKTTFTYSKWAFTIIVAISIGITGHLGGNLTHGSTYLLEYAPNTVRNLAGLPDKVEARKKVVVLDSADVFLDIVMPMMNSTCISCHNDGKRKGGLKLNSYVNMLKGGENGAAIVPGKPLKSELLHRITLPENHEDFMPSEGKRPLTTQEVNLIEWWISNGAPDTGYFTALNPDKKTRTLAENYLGLNKKNQLYSQQVAPPKGKVIDTLAKRGFVINRLMNDNNFLDLNLSLSEQSLLPNDLILLLQLKEQLLWLNLSNSNITDTQLEKIGALNNLIRLDLSNTNITDKGLEHLTALEHLEVLNLYNTGVTDQVFPLLSKLKTLKKVYLWQTNITEATVLQFKKEHPNLVVDFRRE
ncbi:hypothetical protein MWU65_01505 [Cellulophaga sp. F20128]|uniref:c-type cytochrome domain-containing protein n=1 Tax=Cellulophaga sp. F20128 TaxID=2926413 RepID=UPI001FF629EF|nr:c-type cytochrome domain-containing protein [Cellulophaga sp. F20128]MCK0155835.1 hypothetical protein [Cellulophaga sp. F20128]